MCDVFRPRLAMHTITFGDILLAKVPGQALSQWSQKYTQLLVEETSESRAKDLDADREKCLEQ